MVSGFGGCNQYNAPYTVANGLLIVRSRPVSAMMACNPEAMRLEQDFLDGLTRITSSTLDNTGNPRRLTLLLSSGDTLISAAGSIRRPAARWGRKARVRRFRAGALQCRRRPRHVLPGA